MNNKASFKKAAIWFAAFVVFTGIVMFVDPQPVGDTGTFIGLGTINLAVFNKLGFNVVFYKITQVCGLIGVAIAVCSALAGLDQLIKRKSLHFVDPGIIALGIYYVIVVAFYALFELFVVNYRPVYLNYGELEASYPSSHTMLALTIVVALMKYTYNFKKEAPAAKSVYNVACYLFIVVTVVGRLISGVHWLTDIIGAVILSMAIINTYEPIRSRLVALHDKKEAVRQLKVSSDAKE